MAIAAVVVRFGLYLALMILFGVAAFGLYGLRGAERISGKVLPLTTMIFVTAIAGIALSMLGIFILAATMAGLGITQVDRLTLTTVVGETSVGTAFLVRIAALLLAGAASFFLRLSRPAGVALGLVMLAGGVALGSLAWAGHGAATEGGMGKLHLAADIVHLLASAAWIGGLVGLLMLVFRPSRRVTEEHLLLSHRALAGFSTAGTIMVATLAATGIANMLAILGLPGFASLPASLYGRLLIAKLLLFAAMLALAAGNRFRLVPRFGSAMTAGDHRGALGALRYSLIIETGCAVSILALVAWLGTLDPSGAAM